MKRLFVSTLPGLERCRTGISSDASRHSYSTNKRTTGPLRRAHFSPLSCLIRKQSAPSLPSDITLVIRIGTLRHPCFPLSPQYFAIDTRSRSRWLCNLGHPGCALWDTATTAVGRPRESIPHAFAIPWQSNGRVISVLARLLKLPPKRHFM